MSGEPLKYQSRPNKLEGPYHHHEVHLLSRGASQWETSKYCLQGIVNDLPAFWDSFKFPIGRLPIMPVCESLQGLETLFLLPGDFQWIQSVEEVWAELDKIPTIVLGVSLLQLCTVRRPD